MGLQNKACSALRATSHELSQRKGRQSTTTAQATTGWGFSYIWSQGKQVQGLRTYHQTSCSGNWTWFAGDCWALQRRSWSRVYSAGCTSPPSLGSSTCSLVSKLSNGHLKSREENTLELEGFSMQRGQLVRQGERGPTAPSPSEETAPHCEPCTECIKTWFCRRTL